MGLSMGDINDFFKEIKDEDESKYRLLPDFERIITEAKKINITDEKIE